MKIFAYTKKENRSKEDLVNSWQIRRIKKNQPELLDGVKFYSTHKKVENIKELHHSNGRKNPFFRYANGEKSSGSDGGKESITHMMVKEIFADLSTLNLKYGNEIISIEVDEYEFEKRIKIGDDVFIADLFVWFSQSKPMSLVSKWNGVLAIEVMVSSKTKQIKRNKLYDCKIPIFEHNVSDAFKIDEKKNLTEDYIESRKNAITEYYQKVIYGKLISNPSSEMYELEKSNRMLESKLNQLKIEYTKHLDELSAKLEIKNNEIEKLNKDVREKNDLLHRVKEEFVRKDAKIEKLDEINQDLGAKVEYFEKPFLSRIFSRLKS